MSPPAKLFLDALASRCCHRGRNAFGESYPVYHRQVTRLGIDLGAALRELEAAGLVRASGRGLNRQFRLTAAGVAAAGGF